MVHIALVIIWGIVGGAVDSFVALAAVPEPAKWQLPSRSEGVGKSYFAIIEQSLEAHASHHQITDWKRKRAKAFGSWPDRNLGAIFTGRPASIRKIVWQRSAGVHQFVPTAGADLIGWCKSKVFYRQECPRLRGTSFRGDKLAAFLGAIPAIDVGVDNRKIGAQLSLFGIASNRSLIASQSSVDAENYYTYNGDYKRRIFEAVMAFLLGCAMRSGVCCDFCVWGGHTIRAVMLGAMLILVGATITGLVGHSLGGLNFF